MRARDIIVMARRRAGLTQQELGQRLGAPQVTVARWESGATEPKFESVQGVVQACGLQLDAHLVREDRSWWPQIAVQLDCEPTERVRHLTHDRFDRIAALALVGAVGVRAIVVGEVAGALHGWPLILSEHGTLDLVVHPDDRELASEIVAAAVHPDRVRLLDAPTGTRGFADLARSAEPVEVGDGAVQVAGLLDLLRIADASPDPNARRHALAYQAVLDVRRAQLQAPPVESATDEEKIQAWLSQQTPVA
jgi:transcriptional regulator with XRE-family HTH domain